MAHGDSKWDKFVHPYEDEGGVTRYAVAQWLPGRGQYIAPLDAETARRTGCSAEFANSAAGIGGGTSLTGARRRARYLFGDEPGT